MQHEDTAEEDECATRSVIETRYIGAGVKRECTWSSAKTERTPDDCFGMTIYFVMLFVDHQQSEFQQTRVMIHTQQCWDKVK